MQEVETMPEIMAPPETAGGLDEEDLRSIRIARERRARLDAGLSTSRPLEEIMREYGELED
jgi:hypothetical protein